MSRKKGGRTRRKIEKWFRSMGFIVETVERTGKWVKDKDLFASLSDGYSDKGFDSIALGRGGNIILIQCKTNTPAVSGFYEYFAEIYADGNLEVLVATWIDRKGLRLQWYESDGSIIEGWVDSQTINEEIE